MIAITQIDAKNDHDDNNSSTLEFESSGSSNVAIHTSSTLSLFSSVISAGQNPDSSLVSLFPEVVLSLVDKLI